KNREKIKAFLGVSPSLPLCSEAPGVLCGSSVYPLKIKTQKTVHHRGHRAACGLHREKIKTEKR
ncbi:hypothetical protein, partial [Oleiphilus sp. HI0117]|uniref:hypothetical protein n=1 Tax=Oleiphilus sp. HI0117 TaxID=1822261 RepID=UPI001E63B1B9